MLQLDAEVEFIADDRDEALSTPAFEGLGLRRCGQELAHLFEANLITPDRCHDRNVVRTRPQLQERLRVTLALLGNRLVAAADERLQACVTSRAVRSFGRHRSSSVL